MKLLLRFTRQSACRRFSSGSGLLLAGLTTLLLAPLLATETRDAQTLPPCEAAFGFQSFRLGGVLGRHAETMRKGNLLQLDMEKDLLALFRQRKNPMAIYVGLGKTLDAGVHFAALTGDPEITAWKDK